MDLSPSPVRRPFPGSARQMAKGVEVDRPPWEGRNGWRKQKMG